VRYLQVAAGNVLVGDRRRCSVTLTPLSWLGNDSFNVTLRCRPL